jgi:hypothetical protein
MPEVRIMRPRPDLQGEMPVVMSETEAIEFALSIPGWEYRFTDLPSGNTQTFYFHPAAVVLPLYWPNATAEEFAMLFGMTGTVVQLEDDEYQSFISRIRSRSFGLPTAPSDDQ